MRIGLVGCGSIGNVHAQVLAALPGAELCAFADRIPRRAEQYARQYGQQARAYPSLENMLQRENLDALHICTPHADHVPMAITALEKGIAVFMEKPPAISHEQWAALQAAAGESRARVGVCFQNRYNPTTKKVSQLLASGAFGGVRGGRAFVTWHRDAAYYAEGPWRGELDCAGGGALMNQAIHTLDLLLHFLGEPATVRASLQNHHLNGVIAVEDMLEAYLTFGEGERSRQAVFYATTAYGSDAPVFLELQCQRGFIRIEGDYVIYQSGDAEPVLWKQDAGATGEKAYWGLGHKNCIQDFYTCLQDGKPYANDLASVQNTVQTVLEIYENAGKGGQNGSN